MPLPRSITISRRSFFLRLNHPTRVINQTHMFTFTVTQTHSLGCEIYNFDHFSSAY